ncbi:uncharacterized protein BDZ99DRAFT_443396, partial [Mytilinidion resinicola]
MADPFTIIGTTGAVVGIIDVLGKSISALREIHERWKDADFMLLNLAAQLTALRAALREIQTWIDSKTGEPHHQLVMDLDLSMACCKMLVAKIDKSISELQVTAAHNLDFGSKIKVVFGNKTMDSLQKMVERQTNALTLLLSACNCNTSREQKALLAKPTTRKMFKQVRDDSSSLYVLCDSSSLYSRCTDNLSKISMIFQFDRELFLSRPYSRAIRSSVRDSLRQTLMLSRLSKVSKGRGRAVDEDPESASPVPNTKYRILLSEKPHVNLVQDRFYTQTHHNYCNYMTFPQKILVESRDVVRRQILKCIKVMIDIRSRTPTTEQDKKLDGLVERLRQEMRKIGPDDAEISSEVATAISALCAVENFVTLVPRMPKTITHD